MRRFVVVGHQAVTSPDFSLDDLAGATGRLDVLLRCVNSAFMLSHGIRTDTELHLVLLGPPGPPTVLRLVGAELRHLNPDERSTAALLRKALARGTEGRSTPGIYVRRQTFPRLLEAFAGTLVHLREDGEDLRGAVLGPESTFLLADHRDFTDEEEEAIRTLEPHVVGVGPRALHADHCIVVVHNELDRRGA